MRKNALFMALYQLLILLVPFVTLPYISRILGPEGIGTYAYSNSIINYFMLISLLGIHLYGKREIARVNDNDTKRSIVFFEIYYIQFCMSIISIILYSCFILLIDKSIRIVFTIQLIMLLSTFFDISWLYFGMEKFKVCVTRNMLVKILSIIFIFTFIKNKDDLNKYVLVLSVSTTLSQFIMWFNLKKYIKFQKIQIRKILKRLIPIAKLFIPVLSIQLFVVVDKTMLGILSNVQQVGLFENADKITRIPISIITSLGVVMLPRITSLIASGKEDTTTKYIEKSLSFTMFVSIGCAFGIFGIADSFVPIFLGSSFQGSVILVKILAPIVIFISWGNVFRTQYILPKGMDNLYTKTVIYAVVLNIIFNIILIRKYGAIGAAFASILAELLICVYQSVVIRDQFKIIKYILFNVKYLVSGLCMMIIVLIIGKYVHSGATVVVLQLFIGACTYFILSIIFEKLFKQELILSEIKGVLNKFRT